MAAKYPAVSRAIKDAIGDPPARGVLAALARAAGANPSTAGRWVALTQSPDPAQWGAIEDHLGLAPGTLMAAHQHEVGDDLPKRVAALETELRELREATKELARTVLLLSQDEGEAGGESAAAGD